MRYTDLILRDFPIAVWPLDETISGTSNLPCESITDFSNSMDGQYIYNSSWMVSNEGIPLVLGGEKSTFLIQNGSSHSLSVPRLNCFSATSVYTDSTLEFWIKIDNSTDQEVKVLGIDDSGFSDFGLYVYKNYFMFKINDDQFIAAPVQTWNIQHHIAIVYSFSGISIIVDGIKYYANKRVPGLIEFQNNKNFLFYGNSSLGNVQIDAIALYKYGLTQDNCKRHMVYALGANFSGSPFTRNNGIFTTFENTNSKKHNEFLLPASLNVNNFDGTNVIISKDGIQLDNTDKIFYYKNNNSSSNFTFTNQSSLSIENFSNYVDDNFAIAVGITINTLSTEKKTILYIDGTENTGDLELLYQNNNLIMRVYSIDKVLEENPYYEKNIGSVAPGNSYLVAVGFDGSEYKTYINDSSNSYDDVYPIYVDKDSILTLGATPILQDTTIYESYLDNASIYRITVFKTFDEFSSVINSTSGNKSRFDSYYNNMTLTYEERIRLHRKGQISIIKSMDEFGRDVWNGSSNKSICGGIKVETLFPNVTNSEILITIDRYNMPTSTTPASTTIITSQIESLSDIDKSVDLSDMWMELTIDFDSDDCLYFPPILGQLSIISMATPVSTSVLQEFDVALTFGDIEGNIRLYAQDSKPFLEEYMPSSICLGSLSGINISGLPVEMQYNYFNNSKENDDTSGVSTISFFVKRNSVSTTQEVFSWEIVSGTAAPSSCSVYINGQFLNNINLTGKTKILWSELNVPMNKWSHVSIVFNTPLIYENTTKTGPTLLFGNSSGNSNISIQHLGISENVFSAQEILNLYQMFAGQTRVSADDEDTIFVSESLSAVQIYQNNWQRVP